MLQDNRFQAVGDGFAAVGGFLEQLIDVAPLDYVNAAPLAVEELAHRAEEQVVEPHFPGG